MSPRRAPATPPDLPGFAYRELLGSGGFADVFLYEQRMPRRNVAIKVLLADLVGDDARRRFDSEANLMAQLSNHPFIVTIYQADVAADGRPFLVMEHCPLPNLGVRLRREPFGVAEALRTGIELAGAVETVHRAGILHRDIKPANVLVTQYRRPALTDFGISTLAEGGDTAEGLSVPWSPPEAFDASITPTAASDVYSLAATVYSLLAGRAPFDQPGGDNGWSALADRIEHAPLPRLGRPDVPASLDRVLATAMAKSATSRYGTALAFGRALQQVQAELSMPLTTIEVSDELVDVEADVREDDGGTRIRSVVSIDPAPRHAPVDATVVPTPRPGSAAPGSVDPIDPTLHRAAVHDFRGPATASVPVADTMHRPAEPVVASPAPAPQRAPARGRIAAVVAVVALVAIAAVGWTVLRPGAGSAQEPPGRSSTPGDVGPVDPVGAVVPAPADVHGVAGAGGVVFTWTNPDPRDGDLFMFRVADPTDSHPYATTKEPTATVPADPSGRTCLEVLLRHSNGTASAEPGVGCVP